MTSSDNPPAEGADNALQRWRVLQQALEAEGLNVRLVRSRQAVEAAFAQALAAAGESGEEALASPAAFHPEYRSAVLIGSAGGVFWQRARQAQQAEEPLDTHAVARVEELLELLHPVDPSAMAVYPFAHPQRITPFLGFVGDLPLMEITPFGVTLHPRFGPWFAWRAAILTRLELPSSPLPRESPCLHCAAPCTSACPAQAVHKTGFDWRECIGQRLNASTCRHSCPARLACPLGAAYRYSPAQMRYHYAISLRAIRAWQNP